MEYELFAIGIYAHIKWNRKEKREEIVKGYGILSSTFLWDGCMDKKHSQ